MFWILSSVTSCWSHLKASSDPSLDNIAKWKCVFVEPSSFKLYNFEISCTNSHISPYAVMLVRAEPVSYETSPSSSATYHSIVLTVIFRCRWISSVIAFTTRFICIASNKTFRDEFLAIDWAARIDRRFAKCPNDGRARRGRRRMARDGSRLKVKSKRLLVIEFSGWLLGRRVRCGSKTSRWQMEDGRRCSFQPSSLMLSAQAQCDFYMKCKDVSSC